MTLQQKAEFLKNLEKYRNRNKLKKYISNEQELQEKLD